MGRREKRERRHGDALVSAEREKQLLFLLSWIVYVLFSLQLSHLSLSLLLLLLLVLPNEDNRDGGGKGKCSEIIFEERRASLEDERQESSSLWNDCRLFSFGDTRAGDRP